LGFAVEQVDFEIVSREKLYGADDVFFGSAEFLRFVALFLHDLNIIHQETQPPIRIGVIQFNKKLSALIASPF